MSEIPIKVKMSNREWLELIEKYKDEAEKRYGECADEAEKYAAE